MRIKLDENLPVSLVQSLSDLGHDVDSIYSEGLTGQPDEIVWRPAQHEDRIFVTQDLDFSDTRKFTPGTHRGILLVRLRQPGRMALLNRVTEFFRSEGSSDMMGSFVVLTERKIRIRKPS